MYIYICICTCMYMCIYTHISHSGRVFGRRGRHHATHRQPGSVGPDPPGAVPHKHACRGRSGCTGGVVHECLDAGGGCDKESTLSSPEDGAAHTYALTAMVLWKSLTESASFAASAALGSRGQVGARGHYTCACRRDGLYHSRGAEPAPAGAGEWVLLDDEVVTTVSAADVGVSETEGRRGCGQGGEGGGGGCVGVAAGVPYLCVYTRVDIAHASESI